MLVLDYPTKKELAAQVGRRLKYRETSIMGSEFVSNGTIYGCNRPHLTGHKREFFAAVTMKDGVIEKVK